MDLSLTGKVGLVTGGSAGIGKSIATELGREGVDLAICGRDGERLKRAAAELTKLTGRPVLPVQANVTNRDQVDAMIRTVVEEYGHLHILVNSAAGTSGATFPLAEIDDQAILQQFDTKFLGTLRCARAAAPHMQAEGWGRIVTICGHKARNAGNIGGGARNAALVHLTKTLANELGAYGVTVNAIHPGPTRTERTRQMVTSDAERLGISPAEAERRMANNAIRRVVEASEIASLVAFLASTKAAAMTGEVIEVSGGFGTAVHY